jgi:hypothetical protein
MYKEAAIPMPLTNTNTTIDKHHVHQRSCSAWVGHSGSGQLA